MTQHPIHDIDDDVHQRVRLGILASLSGLAKADVRHLKTTLGVTDGNLGRHLQALEEAGLVAQTKTTGNGRPRTWVKITAKGAAGAPRRDPGPPAAPQRSRRSVRPTRPRPRTVLGLRPDLTRRYDPRRRPTSGR